MISETSDPAVTLSLGLKKMSATIQIDENLQPQQIKSSNGKAFIPPFISFVTKTARIGEGALADRQNYPKFVVYDILKLVGKSYNEVEVDKEWGFKLEKRKGSDIFDVVFETANGTRAAHPVILLSLLFKCMIKMIEKQLKRTVKELKINLGKSCETPLKDAIEEAAYIAGFAVVF